MTRRFLLFYVPVILLCGMAEAHARTVEITLLHTTDLHGTLIPRDDYDGNEKMGGLLRLAHLVEQTRAANPNTLLVDSGDFIQGSPETWHSKGQLTIDAMNAMRYDGVVLGNHEFDWGQDFLRTLGARFKAPLLGANIQYSGDNPPLPDLKPYVIRDVDGVRVAIIGLATPAMKLWYRPEYIDGFTFEDALPALERVLPELRKHKPDITVIITHMGFPVHTARERAINQVTQVIKHVPDIDIICGGHTHRVMASYPVKDLIYTQAGYFGIRLGKVSIQFDTVKDEIISKQATMIRVDETVPNHAALEAQLAPQLAEVRSFLTNRLAVSEIALTPQSDQLGHSPVQALFGAALQSALRCDIVIHGALDRDATIPVGPITEQDLWTLVPYENRMGVAQLTAAEIRSILEENAAFLGRRSLMGAWGLDIELDPKAPIGERIKDVRLADGSKLHGRKRYAVAFNSHILSSGGGRFPGLRTIVDQPEARLELTQTQTRAMLRKWLKAKGRITEVPRP